MRRDVTFVAYSCSSPKLSTTPRVPVALEWRYEDAAGLERKFNLMVLVSPCFPAVEEWQETLLSSLELFELRGSVHAPREREKEREREGGREGWTAFYET